MGIRRLQLVARQQVDHVCVPRALCGKYHIRLRVSSGNNFPVTDGWYASSSPVFSPDGKYLFFTSQRDFNPTYSWTEWNHIYKDMTGLYMLTLAKAPQIP